MICIIMVGSWYSLTKEKKDLTNCLSYYKMPPYYIDMYIHCFDYRCKRVNIMRTQPPPILVTFFFSILFLLQCKCYMSAISNHNIQKNTSKANGPATAYYYYIKNLFTNEQKNSQVTVVTMANSFVFECHK